MHHISQSDLDALPTPIALPASRYAQETDVRIKLALMIDTIETVFKYGSAIAIQVMRMRSDWTDFANPTQRKGVLEILRQPQLGEHIGIIQKVYFHFKDYPSDKPRILEHVTQLSQKFPADDLKRLRNRRKGHGAWPCEKVAETALRDFRKAFSKVLEIIKTLNKEFPLYLEPSAIRFSGSEPQLPEVQAQGDENWRLEILDADNKHRIGLYPLFLCKRSGSVIYNGEGDGKNAAEGAVTFLDYFSGADLDFKVGNCVVEDFKASFSAAGYDPHFDETSSSLEFFTGRGNDLRFLDGFIRQDDARILLVSGIRGVGKSTLLERWSQDFARNKGYLKRHFVKEGLPNAEPREVAKHLLHQIDEGVRPAHDWSAADFRTEITSALADSAKDKPLVILMDGIDECATYLKKKGALRELVGRL